MHPTISRIYTTTRLTRRAPLEAGTHYIYPCVRPVNTTGERECLKNDTRVHGPCSSLTFITPVNTRHEHWRLSTLHLFTGRVHGCQKCQP